MTTAMTLTVFLNVDDNLVEEKRLEPNLVRAMFDGQYEFDVSTSTGGSYRVEIKSTTLEKD